MKVEELFTAIVNKIGYPALYSKNISFLYKQSIISLLSVVSSKGYMERELVQALATDWRSDFIFKTPFGIFKAGTVDARRRLYPTYEQDIRNIIDKKHNERIQNGKTTCINIGANIGRWTIELAKMGYDILAFEPVPHTYATLQENISLSNVESKVHTYNIALGDKEGNVSMSTFPFHEGANCVDEVRLAYPKSSPNHIKVPVQRWDCVENICPMLKDKAGLVIIDVEHYEYFVIQGMQDLFQNNNLDVFIEISDLSPHKQKVFASMTDRGYTQVQELSNNNRYFSKKN